MKKLGVAFLLLWPLAVRAQSQARQGTVQRAGCPLVLIDTNRSRFSRTKIRFKVGTRLIYTSTAGRRIFNTTFPYDTDRVAIRDPSVKNRFFLASGRCLFGSSLDLPDSVGPRDPRTPETPPPLEAPSTPLERHFDVGLSLQTLKLRTQVVFPDEEQSSLNAQVLGLLPELTLRWRAQSWEWGGGLGAFYGTAEIGRSLAETQSSELGTFSYQASNLKAFGAEFSPFWLYRPPFGQVALGIKLPLRYMRTAWPLPGKDYQVNPQSEFSVSYLLETRLERENITWIQNIGLYKRWGAVVWSLGVSYRF